MQILLMLMAIVGADLCSAASLEESVGSGGSSGAVLISLLDELGELTAPGYDDMFSKYGRFALKDSSVRCAVTTKQLLEMERCQALILKSGSTEASQVFHRLFEREFSFYKLQVGQNYMPSTTVPIVPAMVIPRADLREMKCEMLLYTAFAMRAVTNTLDGKAQEHMVNLLGGHLLKISNMLVKPEIQIILDELSATYSLLFEEKPVLGVEQTLMHFLKKHDSEMFRLLNVATQESELECFEYEDLKVWKVYKNEGFGRAMKALCLPVSEGLSDETGEKNPRIEFKGMPAKWKQEAFSRSRTVRVMPFTLHDPTSVAGQYMLNFITPIVFVCRLLMDIGKFEGNKGCSTKEGRNFNVYLFRILSRMYVDSPQPVKDLAQGRFSIPTVYAHKLDDIIKQCCEHVVLSNDRNHKLGVCSRQALHDYLWVSMPQFAYIFEQIQQAVLRDRELSVMTMMPLGLPTIKNLNFSILSSSENVFAYLRANALLIMRLTQLSLSNDFFTPFLRSVLETQNTCLLKKDVQLFGRDLLQARYRTALKYCNDHHESLSESTWKSELITWPQFQKHIAKVAPEYAKLWNSMKGPSGFSKQSWQEEVRALKDIWRLCSDIRSADIYRLMRNVMCDTESALKEHGQEELIWIFGDASSPFDLGECEVPASWNTLGLDDFSNFSYQFYDNCWRIAGLSAGLDILQSVKWRNEEVVDKIQALMVSELELILNVPKHMRDYGLACPRYMHGLSVIVCAWNNANHFCLMHKTQKSLQEIVQQYCPEVLAWHQKAFKAYGRQLSSKYGWKEAFSDGMDLLAMAQAITEKTLDVSESTEKQRTERLMERVESALMLLKKSSSKGSSIPAPRDVVHSELMKSWWSHEGKKFQYFDWELKELLLLITQYPEFMKECFDECVVTLKDAERVLPVIRELSLKTDALKGYEPPCSTIRLGELDTNWHFLLVCGYKD